MKKYNILKLLFVLLLVQACSNSKTKSEHGNILNNNLTSIENIKSNDNSKDIIFLQTIYFDFNSYDLTYEAKSNLKLLIKYLLQDQNKYKTIILTGYCDQVGSDNYNYDLGLKRTEETKQYLIKNNIDGNRIKIISIGKDKEKNERKVVININN